MRTYYLNVKNKDDNPIYTLEESLRDKNKRRIILMGYTIEELDKMTGTFSSFQELSKELNITSSDVIKFLFMNKKMMVNINSVLNDETIGEICLEFGFDITVNRHG